VAKKIKLPKILKIKSYISTMEIFIVVSLSFVLGYTTSSFSRLYRVGKCLMQLDVRDQEFEAKISIIRVFNTMF